MALPLDRALDELRQCRESKDGVSKPKTQVPEFHGIAQNTEHGVYPPEDHGIGS